uniref:Uncharacterized protein n=1 Tax=Laticauda laticaudata TaxID=8630 RepID=A0A8C5RWC2_LATLA
MKGCLYFFKKNLGFLLIFLYLLSHKTTRRYLFGKTKIKNHTGSWDAEDILHENIRFFVEISRQGRKIEKKKCYSGYHFSLKFCERSGFDSFQISLYVLIIKLKQHQTKTKQPDNNTTVGRNNGRKITWW